MDSEASSSTPYPAAKRQRLEGLHPRTPTALCSSWQHQPKPQSTHQILGSSTLSCSGSRQRMLQQPQRRSSLHSVATQLQPQTLFEQAMPVSAPNSECRQQWTELHRTLSQHQCQQQRRPQPLAQSQTWTQTSQPRGRCCHRQTSSVVQQTDNSELIDFVQQVFDTYTPPQQQEQLQSCSARQPQEQLPCLTTSGAFISSASRYRQAIAGLRQQQQIQPPSRATLSQEHIQYPWQARQHMQARNQLALLKQNAAVQQSLLARQHPVAVRQPTPLRAPKPSSSLPSLEPGPITGMYCRMSISVCITCQACSFHNCTMASQGCSMAVFMHCDAVCL